MEQVGNIVSETLKKHTKERKNLLPVLQELVEKHKFLTKGMIQKVAKAFDLSNAEVYGVASFYSFLDVQPRGKHVIRICKTITCDLKDKISVVKAVEGFLNIKMGETTSDNQFSLLETNCLGHCHVGPVMLVNDEVYTSLTPIKAVEILKTYISD